MSVRYLKFETEEWIETYLFNDADWFYFCVEKKLNAENLVIHNCMRLCYHVWYAFSSSAI